MKLEDEEIEVLDAVKGNTKSPFLGFLDKTIRGALRVLAVLMTLVIFWGVADVAYILYGRLMEEPKYLLDINDIFATFSGFMAVLIAIEIYTNITIYLKDNLIHVKIVMATALMAIARKVIVLDFTVLETNYLVGIGAVMLSTGVVYWLTHKIPRFRLPRTGGPAQEEEGSAEDGER